MIVYYKVLGYTSDARRHLGEQVRGWSVLHWDANAVQGRHPLLLRALHLQGAVLKTPHGVHPGLLGIK